MKSPFSHTETCMDSRPLLYLLIQFVLVTQSCPTLRPRGLWPTRLSQTPPLTLALVFISHNCCYSFNILFMICFHILATRSQGFTHQLQDFSTHMLQNLKLLNNSEISETPNTLSIEKGKNSPHNLKGSNTPQSRPLPWPMPWSSLLS